MSAIGHTLVPIWRDTLSRALLPGADLNGRQVEINLPYLSYLLRLWPVITGGGLVWRMSLDDPHTDRRIGFTSLAALVAFLESEMADTGREQMLSKTDARSDAASNADRPAPSVSGTNAHAEDQALW